MKTLYWIINPDSNIETREVDWPEQPNYEEFKKLLAPHIEGDFEHVSVFYNLKPHDMFVDEIGLIKGLQTNHLATMIYHQNTMWRALRDAHHLHPKELTPICGPVVFFPGRRVWF